MENPIYTEHSGGGPTGGILRPIKKEATTGIEYSSSRFPSYFLFPSRPLPHLLFFCYSTFISIEPKFKDLHTKIHVTDK